MWYYPKISDKSILENMRILIVEDEESIAKLVKDGLENEGYAVDHVNDGIVAERRILIHHKDYDIIILDLTLPGKTGFQICSALRAKGISTPVLALTARSDTADKVAMLDCGADDYLVKPFAFKELIARVRALTRRPKNTLPVTLKIGNLQLDSAKMKAYYKKKELGLTLKEFRVLEMLMRDADTAVNREDILSKVWDFEFDSFSNVVDVHIKNLRKKIGGKSDKMIETVRGIGYVLKSKEAL